MTVWLGFHLRCSCGHVNLPHQSPREGIRIVLTGQFRQCDRCLKSFERIYVPERPIVLAVKAEVDAAPIQYPVPYEVHFFAYRGTPPMARGDVQTT